MTHRPAILALAALFAAATAKPAASDGPALNADACPGGAVSIYFGAGDIMASPQAQAVLGKVREAAGECSPDAIEVVAYVHRPDDAVGGMLAMERLTMVADELVARGVPAERIRTLTETSTNVPAEVVGRQVEILFLKKTAPANKAAPAKPALARGHAI